MNSIPVILSTGNVGFTYKLDAFTNRYSAEFADDCDRAVAWASVSQITAGHRGRPRAG